MAIPFVALAGIIAGGAFLGSAVASFFGARAEIDKTVNPINDIINNPYLSSDEKKEYLEIVSGTDSSGDGEKSSTDGGGLFGGLLPAVNVDLSGVVSAVLPAVAILAGGLILIKAVGK